MPTLRSTVLTLLKSIRPSTGLLILATLLLLIDHRFTELTWGGLSLGLGAAVIRKVGV